MDITALIERMVLLMATLAVGFIAAKCKVADETTNQKFSAFVVNIASPLMILASVMNSEHLLSNLQVLLLTGIAAGCYVLAIATSFIFEKIVHPIKEEAGIYRFMYVFSNLGFVGYPLAEALFGGSAVFYMSIFVMFFQLVCWSYGEHLIAGEGKFKISAKIFRSPCVIAALVSYVIYFSNIHFPAIVSECVDYVGDLTSPMAMIVIGVSLAKLRFGQIFGNWRIYVLSFFKLLVIPVVIYLIISRFTTNVLLLGIPVLAWALPVATNTTIISYQHGKNDAVASSGVFVTTLISAVSLPLLMKLLFP